MERDDIAPTSDADMSDPVTEAYKAGIDRTLLRANLARSVTERVTNLMELQRLVEEAQRGRRRRSG